MASNRFLTTDQSVLLKKKLELLANKLQTGLENSEFSTYQQYMFEMTRVMTLFYDYIDQPLLNPINVQVDQLPSLEDYNNRWRDIQNDLFAIFKELENIETLTVANFNFITTEANRLVSRLKSVSSKLGDYILYSSSPNKDAFFYKDSFNDLSRIDLQSPLLNTLECTISQEEGVVILPIDIEKESKITVIEAPIINSNSNGTVGNNQQIGAQWHGDVKLILDSNPDTWFEYERIVSTAVDSRTPLLLDMTINLGQETIVNRITINPNNFGTKTAVIIDTIETSTDGHVFISIKDDIPIGDIASQNSDEPFVLTPATSKYAGQGIYTFTPRLVKYVHLVFRQNESYVIETPAGPRLRYAIGLRDIDIQGIHFKEKGELVSKSISSNSEIRKVSLEVNQNPLEHSDLCTIQYLVSPDEGQSWYELLPRNSEALASIKALPRILEFNGASLSSIDTSVPVYSLKLKTILSRIDSAFTEGATVLKKTVGVTSELHEMPTSAPFEMKLSYPPIRDSITVIDPLYGSRGLEETPYILGHTHDRLNLRTYRLPLTNIQWPNRKISNGSTPPTWRRERVPASDFLHIEVGGEEWSQSSTPMSSWGNTDKYFILDPNKGHIRFGDGTKGKLPGENEPISMWLEPESLALSDVKDNHLAKLDFPTSANKHNIIIERWDGELDSAEIVQRGATVIRLGNKNITNYDEITTKLGSGNQVTFLNGRDELTTDSSWSIDTKEGIVYLKIPLPLQSGGTLLEHVFYYKYRPIYQLSVDEWDWANTNLLRDSISIKDTAWKTLEILEEELAVTEGNSIVELSTMYIVPKTIEFELTDNGGVTITDSNNPFMKEIQFIDGNKELGRRIVKTSEQVPPLRAVSYPDVVTFNLRQKIINNTDYPVYFSNKKIFATEVFVTPAAVGEYYVNRVTNEIEVYVDRFHKNVGYVHYYCNDPNFIDNGLYSVDYRNGTVYMQREFADSTWQLKVSYQYTDFRAKYHIARKLPTSSYLVDNENLLITIQDNEILLRQQIPRIGLTNQQSYYIVNYEYVMETRENIEDLKNFFTPIVKDYALKILTKGTLF